MCEPSQLKCVNEILEHKNPCLQRCQGLFITGIDRIEYDKETLEGFLSQVREDYELYKAENWYVDESSTGTLAREILVKDDYYIC